VNLRVYTSNLTYTVPVVSDRVFNKRK